MPWRSSRRLLAPVLAVGLALGLGTGLTAAAFSSSTSNPASSFASKRIYSAQRTTSAWQLDDAADGSAADGSDPAALVDGRYYTTANWASSWATTRYVEFELNTPLAAGLAVQGLSFDFTFADNDTATGNQWCFYFEVRKTSDASVVSTHGSSSSTLGCEAAGTQTTVSTALPAITTSDQANDLTIRVYGQHSGGGKAARIDSAVVRGAASYANFTLYPTQLVDSADTTPATDYWEVAKSGEGQAWQTASWSNAFSATRYVEWTFPTYHPTAGTVTAAAFDFSYRSTTSGDQSCYYFEVFAYDTLIGTHGSTSTPVSCNTSNTTYVTDTTSLPEIDTPAEAASAVVKVYVRNSGSRPVQIDVVRLRVTYHLDPGSGCVSSSSQTLTASEDSWGDEASPTSTAGASDANLDVQSRAADNARAFVKFGPYPELPTGCAVTARLRLYSTTVSAARTIEAYRATASWAESTLNWNNQPAYYAGTVASVPNGTASTWKIWDASSLVTEQLANGNFGFVLKDSAESAATTYKNDYNSSEGTNPPQLQLAFGNGSVPYGTDIQAVNATGTAGRPDAGDTLTYTFSEELDAASVLSGWDGTSTSVTVRVVNNGAVDDVAVWNSGNTTQLPLGVADLGDDYASATCTFGATMVKSGSTITITLGTLTSGTPRTDTGLRTITWDPSPLARDLAGNLLAPWSVTEGGASDANW